jgi:hypothetical protein
MSHQGVEVRTEQRWVGGRHKVLRSDSTLVSVWLEERWGAYLFEASLLPAGELKLCGCESVRTVTSI